jgi:DUF1680 family protein
MSISRRHFVGGASLTAIGALFARPVLSQQQAQALAATSANGEPAASQAVMTASHRLNPVPIENVTITDAFWSPRRKTWQEVTIRDCFRKFESDRGGAVNNFDKVRDGKLGGHAGDPWMDGLVYEMIRGASDFLVTHPDPELEKQLEDYGERIAAAAAKDPRGYVNTYTQLVEPGHDWGLNGGLQIWQHEIYNLGALVDAGNHFYRATGKTTLLVPGVRIANYMYSYMGPAPKKNIVPCHPLPEEALVRLYELFKEQPELKSKLGLPVDENHYLELAEFWIEARGNNIGLPNWEHDRSAAEQFVRDQKYGDGRPSWGAYAQDDKPVFEQEVIEGHAVRATLLCAGLAAAARVNDDPRYRESSVRLWENMVYRRMHITGGVGAYAQEEKFGPDYTLPNDAYLETCAAVGAAFFHQNMNQAFGHARYADELERVLYNGALSGVSLKGDTYLYMNPLEGDVHRSRWVWHECPCCPPMFVKLMGAMPGYIYAADEDSVYVNLYVSSTATIPVKGSRMKLKQTSNYPWDGEVRIAIEEAPASECSVMVRIPAWCKSGTVKVNGKPVNTAKRTRGYVSLNEAWKTGDIIEVSLPMPVEHVRALPQVRADLGKAAVMRGPLVYCFESADNGAHVASLTLEQAKLAVGKPSELDGALTLEGTMALAAASNPGPGIYQTETRDAKTVQVTAIPYYANLNRGPVEMAVWMPLQA